MSVNDVLIENTKHTKALLKEELEIRLNELMEKIFFSSLLKIFIQEGMYKHPDYENAGNFEVVVDVLNRLFTPFFDRFYREIQPEDYKKLIDKPMSSITRFDVKKADEQMKALEEEIKDVKHHLRHLTDYAIAWFQKLKDKYGKGRERKTEIRIFEKVEAAQVALANVKLYVNRADGFIGAGLKKDEYVGDCSDIDDIITFLENGTCLVTKVQDKVFVGKDIIHVGVFKKGDERTVYNMIYRDAKTGVSYIKRFSILSVTRDKVYDLTKGSKGSKVLYFTANPNGEAEVVHVQLKPHSKLRKLQFDLDFAEIAIKGRNSQGNIVSKYPVKKIILKSKGVSTLAGRKIWYDEVLHRLNVEGRGKYLGEFDGDDRILVVMPDGSYNLNSFELTNHFDPKLLRIEKYFPELVYTAVHVDGKSGNYLVKRFSFEHIPLGKSVSIINDEAGSKLVLLTQAKEPVIKLEILKGKSQLFETIEQPLNEIVDVKGMKAQGNRLSQHEVKKIVLLSTEEAVDENSKPAMKDEKKSDPVSDAVIKEETETGEVLAENSKEEARGGEQQATSKPKVDFEITNPDDIDLEEGGQQSLF